MMAIMKLDLVGVEDLLRCGDFNQEKSSDRSRYRIGLFDTVLPRANDRSAILDRCA